MTDEELSEDYVLPIGKANIEREGTDITFIGYSRWVGVALEAAEELAKIGVSAEVRPPSPGSVHLLMRCNTSTNISGLFTSLGSCVTHLQPDASTTMPPP